MAARISRTTYPFWQTAPKMRLMTISCWRAGGIGFPPLVFHSADRPAAVDDEFGSCDVAAFVAGKPQDAVGDIFRHGLVAERHGAFGELVQRRTAFLAAVGAVLDGTDQRVPDRGFRNAGMQRVDAHAVPC